MKEIVIHFNPNYIFHQFIINRKPKSLSLTKISELKDNIRSVVDRSLPPPDFLVSTRHCAPYPNVPSFFLNSFPIPPPTRGELLHFDDKTNSG